MKKIGLIFCFLIFTSVVFGQQFLWSTSKDANFTYLPLDSVVNEVLNYYDQYDYYSDGAGFNKDEFLNFFEANDNDSEVWRNFKTKINEIEDLTVYAFRAHLEEGSGILVISISKNNVNVVAFSNIYDSSSIGTYSSSRDKFKKWFKSLLK